MKRIMGILCALLLVCLSVAASAEAPVSNLYRPIPSETLKSLVANKSFEARITGWESTGEDEDTHYMISITVCERDRFDPAVVENLAKGDIICFGNGTSMMITDVARDEYGINVKDGFGYGCSFIKSEDGTAYIATTETDNPFYTEVFTVIVPLEKDISFLDWSDPENLDAPVKLGFDELLNHLLEGTNFAPYNAKVTFDENGKLVEFLYSYSPWN